MPVGLMDMVSERINHGNYKAEPRNARKSDTKSPYRNTHSEKRRPHTCRSTFRSINISADWFAIRPAPRLGLFLNDKAELIRRHTICSYPYHILTPA